jgi:hypothetical protein
VGSPLVIRPFKAIGLGDNIGDIAAGQTTFGFEDVYLYFADKKKIMFLP